MGKTRVLYHPNAMRGSAAFSAVKKLLLVGFVLGMVACTVGYQRPKELKARPQAGAVFTRWGRTVCPSGATRVYKGVIGGGNSNDTGVGADYLCLPESPEWGNYDSRWNSYSVIHGVVYQAGDGLFDKRNACKVAGNKAVCVVCQSERSVQLMIPGKRNCMEGWIWEYHGYLMSANWNEKGARNWICVDNAPEVATSNVNSRGQLWPVEVAYDTIPIPGYKPNAELTCVVCSK